MFKNHNQFMQRLKDRDEIKMGSLKYRMSQFFADLEGKKISDISKEELDAADTERKKRYDT